MLIAIGRKVKFEVKVVEVVVVDRYFIIVLATPV